jgi:hypothetical protein
MTMDLLINALRKVAVAANGGAVAMPTDEIVKDVIEKFKGSNRITFVWLDCESVTDAPLAFWKLYKAKALADVCHVVFTSATTSKPGLIRAWQEMTQLYGGTVFGDLYLMRFTNLVKPVIVSCMKGIFN